MKINPKLKSLLLSVLKFVIGTFLFLWSFANVIATIAYYQTLEFVSNLLNLDQEYLLAHGESSINVSFIDRLFDTFFFQAILVLSFAISFLGAVLLAKKRSVLSFIGLFAAFIIPPDRERFGKIIDINTQKPIPFAVVRLFDFKNKKKVFLKETVSDTGGNYKLEIDKTNINPIIEVSASGYLDIYNKPAISGDGEITQDIYLSTQLNKSGIYYNFLSKRTFLFDNLTILIYILTIIFFVIYFYYFLAYPGYVYGIINFTLFSIALISNSRLIYKKYLVKKAAILDKATKEPVIYAKVTLFDSDRQLESRYTDNKGRVRFTLEPGNYKVKVEKSGFKTYEWVNKVEVGKNGFLKSNIFLTKSDSSGTQNSESFANPFA